MIIRFIEAPAHNIRNGNVVTSERWRRFFEELGHGVTSSPSANDEPCDILVAFNASKNRQAILEARNGGIAGHIVICLTGTDLYVDLKNDPSALDVLYLADQLAVLQPMALHELAPRPAAQTPWSSFNQPILRGFDVNETTRSTSTSS